MLTNRTLGYCIVGIFLYIYMIYYCSSGVLVAESDVVKTVPVTVGESVTLETITDIQRYEQIEWRFESVRIARIKEKNGVFSTDYHDSRFIDRLHLDNHTGSLTITNIGHEHSGVYKQSIGVKDPAALYNVTVYRE